MNPTEVSTAPGAQTLSEILSQPQCWSTALPKLASSKELQTAVKMARPGAEWIFVGCGTSYYLAMAAAAAFNSVGLPARPIPGSEILLYPSMALPPGRDYIPIAISRSGHTSETVRAARVLEKDLGLPTIAITCADGQELEAECSLALKLLDADEQSTVMTRSFTSMLLGLQYLATKIAGREDLSRALLQVPEETRPLLTEIPQRIHSFVAERGFDTCIFLAQGALFGIASESMLKVTESSCTFSQVFHSLEFRHGPRSIAGPGTLITFLMSESSYEAELDLLEEMKKQGAATVAIANRLDDRARKAADFSIELGLRVPEFARPAVYTMWGQLYGSYNGLKKGLNPDAPPNLTRVVVLG